MYVNLGNFSCPFYIGFDDQEEAKDTCELLKELLNAKKSCRGAIFCTRPPQKKQIDEHVTS